MDGDEVGCWGVKRAARTGLTKPPDNLCGYRKNSKTQGGLGWGGKRSMGKEIKGEN